MLSEITTYKRYGGSPAYTLLIPTWNNKETLELCLNALKSNSELPHQIIVIVNEGKDGTLDALLDLPNIDILASKTNIGICYGLNACRSMILAPYVVYMNDDMVALPGWDKALLDVAEAIPHKMFMLSGTMIEPRETGNKAVLVADFGTSHTTFKQDDLLKALPNLTKSDWQGSTWPPNLLPIELWDLVGGMSIEFSPGMYSDPDLSMKLWKAGVRHFQGVGNSKVYHFGSQSTGRVKRNPGKWTFLNKWGISSHIFTEKALRRGSEFDGQLNDFEAGWALRFTMRLKRIFQR